MKAKTESIKKASSYFFRNPNVSLGEIAKLHGISKPYLSTVITRKLNDNKKSIR